MHLLQYADWRRDVISVVLGSDEVTSVRSLFFGGVIRRLLDGRPRHFSNSPLDGFAARKRCSPVALGSPNAGSVIYGPS